MSEIDVEVEESVIVVHGDEVRNVEVGGLEEIDFAAEVEIKKAIDRAASRDDTGGDASVLTSFLKIGPVRIAARARLADRNGKRIPAGGRVMGIFLEKHGVGHVFGTEGGELLAVFLIKDNQEANVLQIDLDALIGGVLKIDVKSDNATGERSFLGKLVLILARLGPRVDADGHAFVRVGDRIARRRGLR